MKCVAQSPSQRRAFSLIELLVAVAVIGVLVKIGFAVYGSAINRTHDVQCVMNLRKIGMGIAGYVQDNEMTLPGPLLPTQGPRYNKVNGEQAAYLASFIARYADIPEAESGPLYPLDQARRRAPMFYCQAFESRAQPNFANTYFMRWRISEMNTAMPPWGNYGTSTPQIPKSIMEIPNPAKTWAVSDLDRRAPDLPAQSWASSIPTEPVHSGGRNALFFDWHVGKISDEGKEI